MAVPNGNPEPEARAIPESQDMLETLQPADEDGPTPVEEDLEIDPTDGQPVIPPEEKPVEEEAAKPAADAPLAERLRASLPESVSAEEIDAIETELAEHKSYRELFEGVEDAHNAVDCREDLRLLAGDIHSGDFQRVWNNLPAANSARAVQSIREDFARVHPQAYAELEKSIYLDALQHLERKMDGYADKETARIGKLVTNVFGQEIMGEKDWRTLVEDPAIAEQRKKLEADRETMTQQILQRDWSTIWNGITQTFTYKIQSALRKGRHRTDRHEGESRRQYRLRPYQGRRAIPDAHGPASRIRPSHGILLARAGIPPGNRLRSPGGQGNRRGSQVDRGGIRHRRERDRSRAPAEQSSRRTGEIAPTRRGAEIERSSAR